MATKISELTTATTLDGSELIPVVQGGVTKQTSVTDLVSGGELPAYSTTETVTTERWTDGKPIYSKVINHSFAGAGVGNTSSVVAADIEQITNAEWVIYQSNGSISFEGKSVDSASTLYYDTYLNSSHTIYAIANHVGWANQPIILTLRYTKTTDTAASPVAGVTVTENIISPQIGVEQLTGRIDYVNNKPIYTQVFSGTISGASNISTGLTGVDSCTVSTYRWVDTSGKTQGPFSSHYVSGTSQNRVSVTNSGATIDVNQSGQSWDIGQTIYVVLEYTKTAD